jgi:malonyl-CoA O-methyltransferase
MTLVKNFTRAMGWIDRWSLAGQGIAVTARAKEAYPEVSGYYIPTLLQWNEIERAKSYAQWLIRAQLESGAWTDPTGNHTCVFDTGQILRGLWALHCEQSDKELENALLRGCQWVTSFVTEEGALEPPDEEVWAGAVPLGVLLYSLEPVKRIAEGMQWADIQKKAEQAIAYLVHMDGVLEFTTLSHFHAYIMEALVDLGYNELALQGMQAPEKLQRKNGAVPAFKDVTWVCSTGLFQYAIVWYKLGDLDRANKAFDYAVKLQNRSGGWYGSYGFGKKYFPWREISWAVKYFLDALQLKLYSSFEEMSPIFSEQIDSADGRYQLVLETIQNAKAESVLDAGCGKGRYLRNLLNDVSFVKLFGSDLSSSVMSTIPTAIETKQGSLLRLPYADSTFDLVYTVEALEHAVHIDAAIRELARVVKRGGVLLIVDKNRSQLGRLKLPSWEQWFDTNGLTAMLQKYGFSVKAIEGIPYEGKKDKLFTGWIGVKGL